MKEITKLAIILLIITSVAAAGLGYVNGITEGPIAEQLRLADIEARKQVLPEAEDFQQLDIESPDDYKIVSEVFKGTVGENKTGYTFKTVPSGYGGTIEVMVGISSEGVVTGVSIGNHTETPGLGAKAANDDYKGQYTGKTSDMEVTVIKAGAPSDNEVVAISGATITSRAVTDGVNEAIRYFNEKLR